jgi:transcriptional regulator with XRE-family HTH domain
MPRSHQTNALKTLVDEHLAKVRRATGNERYSQADLANEINFKAASASKYITGAVRPSGKFLDALLTHIYERDKDKILEKKREILSAGQPTKKDRSVSFEDFEPLAAAFEFDPFLKKKNDKEKNFTDTICRRLFDLANKHFEIKYVEQFDEMFSLVRDLNAPQTMILHISETIPRSVEFYTFHSPVAAPLNIVIPLLPNGKPERDSIRERFLSGSTITNHDFVGVREEIGYSYLREALKVPDKRLEGIDAFDPKLIAKTLLLNNRMVDERGEARLFIADEFLCMPVAEQLNTQVSGGVGGKPAYGFLFPLGTLAVARSDRFAKIPTYKYGLFSMPRRMEGVIDLLRQSLNTLFDNERFFVALAYTNLAAQLTALAERSIQSLPDQAKEELEALHHSANEYFQFSWRSDEFPIALASRVTRQAMRLNTQLIQTDDDLNLRWRPILELVRSRLLGPLPLEYRDLRFDQASIQCIVMPPFITTNLEEKPGSQKETHGAPGVRIVDWGIFGPVLAQISDLINLEGTELIPRDSSVSGEDGIRINLPHDLNIGTLDVPRRAYDLHYFRFPVSARLNAIVPKTSESTHTGKQDLVVSLLPSLEKLFANETTFERQTTRFHIGKALGNTRIVPIVLKNTAAHYLCWDWDQHPIFIEFDPSRHNLAEMLGRFVDMFRSRLREYGQNRSAIPIIIADDFTCFRICAGSKLNEGDLLFKSVTEGRRTRYFHSIGIQRTKENGWWEIMREMLPVAIGKSEAELVAKMQKMRENLESEARGWYGKQLPNSFVTWLDDVFCRDFIRPHEIWNDEILSRAWQPVLSRVFKSYAR